MLKYINSQGVEVDLSQFPTRLKEAVFHDYSWGYEGATQRFGIDIDYFKKDPKAYDLVIAFSGTNQQKRQLLNTFCDITEYDVQNNSPGKLYVDDYYISCFVIGSKTEPGDESAWVERTLDVLCPYPFWILESTYSFLPETDMPEPEVTPPVTTGGVYQGISLDNGAVLPEFEFDFLRPSDQKTEYPLFDLPFDFVGVFGSRQINNPAYLPGNFIMTIYGYAVNPAVIIAGHTYQVYATVYSGERLVIDSRKKTVIKIGRFGEETNLYNARNKLQSVFEKIPSGASVLSWEGDFGVDLTIFDERSEPKWSLQSATPA